MRKKATGIQLIALSVKQEWLRLRGSSLPIDRPWIRGWPKTRPERRAKIGTRPALRVGNQSGQTWPARAELSKSRQAPQRRDPDPELMLRGTPTPVAGRWRVRSPLWLFG